MEHIAIDLGSKESQICIRDSQGQIVEQERIATQRLAGYFSGRAAARVIVETSAEAFWVADAAQAHGHEVRVVPATLVRSLGVGHRGLKNDVRDAQILSEVSCRIELPSVHIPSSTAREVKALNTSRQALVRARTQLVNRVRSYLRSHPQGRGVRCTTKTFATRVRARFLSDSEGLPAHIERTLVVLDTLSHQIAELDQELLELATQDERSQRLMSIPGVGPVTATLFVAAIDQVQRFHDAAHLASYLGLTPGENTTGFVTKRTRLTKAGCASLRGALVQASWCLWRLRPDDPMVVWAKQVADRRGKQIAIVALARKLSTVMYAMWRDQTQYTPRRGRTAV